MIIPVWDIDEHQPAIRRIAFTNYDEVAPATTSVSLDNTAYGQTGGTSLTVSITIGTGLSSQALVLFGLVLDTGTVAISSVSGAGATWTQFSANVTGNGNLKGSCWVGTGVASTGAQTITATMSGVASGFSTAVVYSLAGVNQTTPLGGTMQTATSGSLAVSIASGDMAVSVMGDTNNNRTVSGCTSTTDLSAFSDLGYSGAHCTANPTSTFTWSAFGATSIALGVDAQHA